MTARRSPALFPAPEHNHGPCLAETHARAEAAFAARGLRLTPIRLEVLDEIAASHAAIGAYDVLDRLARKGRRLAPISVYRAIDALVEAGIVHKLETQNAFFACHRPDEHAREPAGGGQLVLTCNSCGTVAELAGETVREAIAGAARSARFKIASSVLEVRGTCSNCSSRRE